MNNSGNEKKYIKNIAYVCKYTPLEIFAGFNTECRLIDKLAEDFDRAGRLSHDNLCGFGKAMLQEIIDKRPEAVILTNCCDTMKRLYEVVADQNICGFTFLMDLPHRQACCSAEKLSLQFRRLISEYEEYSGAAFDREAFIDACAAGRGEPEGGAYIGILGARCGSELENTVRSMMPADIKNMTCVRNRQVALDRETLENMDFDSLVMAYAQAVLGQFPCGRMGLYEKRRELFSDPNLKGIIYHTIKFCDYYEMEYNRVKQDMDVPVLKLETDYTRQSEGQLKTRIEAFAETLSARNAKAGIKPDTGPVQKTATAMAGRAGEGTLCDGLKPGDGPVDRSTEEPVAGAVCRKGSGAEKPEDAGAKAANGFNRGKAFFAGIDSGSTSTDVVIMDSGKNIVSSVIIPTGGGANISAEQALKQALDEAGISRDSLVNIVKTGYGRDYIGEGNSSVTEITCHALGAHFLYPEARTVIDIGGQDSKAIKIDENGAVVNFVMNDKCAAGTGRFMEMMARALGLELAEMSRAGLGWKEDIAISSMCTVFAESEVVSLIARNKAVPDIVHGLDAAVASKVASLAKRVQPEEGYIMTGGVANNDGVVKALEEKLGAKLFICPEAQLCGAIGAALFALEQAM